MVSFLIQRSWYEIASLGYIAHYPSNCMSMTCPKLSFKYCDANDVPSGSTRIEYETSDDCKTFETRYVHTDYECKTTGTLISKERENIDGAWVSTTQNTTREDNELEYGKTTRNRRLLWADQYLRIEETYSESHMVLNLLDDSYWPREEKGKRIQQFIQEEDEVVRRALESSRYRSPYTKNQWLKKSEETIAVFDILQ